MWRSLASARTAALSGSPIKAPGSAGGYLLKFRPLHDRVVVKRIEAEDKTTGGIITPDTSKEKLSQGAASSFPS